MRPNFAHLMLGSAVLVTILSATDVRSQTTAVGQAIRHACRAEIDAYWDAHLKVGNGRSGHYKNKEEVGGWDRLSGGQLCGPSAQNAQWIRDGEKRVAEAAEKVAYWTEKKHSPMVVQFEESLTSAKMYLCVQRWFDTPQCRVVLGPAPAAPGAAAATASSQKPKPSVRQVQVKQVEAKGSSNGCIKVRALETKPWGETGRETSLETTIELQNTCKTEQKFDTRYPKFPVFGMTEGSEITGTAHEWWSLNGYGYFGPGYQLWQAYMPLPKDLGFLRPKIATLDSSAAIVPGGILHTTVLQTAIDGHGRELPLVDPVIVRTASCDFTKGGRQQIVLADVPLENFTCRFPPPEKPDWMSQQWTQAMLLARERQVKASQDRKGKGKKHARAAEANDCIQLSGKSGSGSLVNSCAYPVEIHYCAAKPASGARGQEINCDRTSGAGARLGAGASHDAPIKGAASVHWFACKDGAIPVDVEYVDGQGLRGRCHGS